LDVVPHLMVNISVLGLWCPFRPYYMFNYCMGAISTFKVRVLKVLWDQFPCANNALVILLLAYLC